MEIKQGKTFKAKVNFTFRNALTKRVVKVKVGDEFWVTSTALDLQRTNAVEFSRKGKPMHSGMAFSKEDFESVFEPSEE